MIEKRNPENPDDSTPPPIRPFTGSNRAGLGTEPIGKLLIKLSLPATVAMVVNGLYNLVDTIFIGRGVGTEAIGGLALAFPVQMIVMAFGMSIGVGSASIVSRNLGSGNESRARRAAGNAFAMALALSIVVMVAGRVFIEPLLILLGASEVLAPYARDYLEVILLGSPFIALAMVSNNIIRAEGRAMISMTVMLIGALTNIILDPIFIFVLELGVSGAAWATIAGQFLAFLVSSIFFLTKRSSIVVRPKHWIPDGSIIRETIALGIPALVRQAGQSVVAVLLNNMLVIYGSDIYVSAYGVLNRLVVFLFMPLFGTVQGFQPIAGFNYGARLFHRVDATLKKTALFATVYTSVGFLLLFFLPRMFARIFSTDPVLIDATAYTIRFVIAALPLVGLQIVGGTYFMAIGKSLPSLILNLSRQVLLLIPLLIVLPRFFGLVGLLVSFPIADFLATFITLIWLSGEIKDLRKLEAAERL